MSDTQLNETLWSHQMNLTKPARSLGRIEALAVQLGMIQGTAHPVAAPATVHIFVSDHPVAAEVPEISAFPQEVTGRMVENFVNGGAAACVLAQQHRIPLKVHDVGVGGAKGTGDLRLGEAMTEKAFRNAVNFGIRVVGGDKVVLLGEMGIGNSTAAAAVTGALLNLSAEQVTGFGTGVLNLEPKLSTVEAGIAAANRTNPESILRSVGGCEIAALYGAMQSAYEQGATILIDGFIVTAAALVLCKMNPAARKHLIFAHRSREGGQRYILEELDAEPLLDLDLALGEATGALLAYPLLVSACALHNEMATFESAGVARALDEENNSTSRDLSSTDYPT